MVICKASPEAVAGAPGLKVSWSKSLVLAEAVVSVITTAAFEAVSIVLPPS